MDINYSSTSSICEKGIDALKMGAIILVSVTRILVIQSTNKFYKNLSAKLLNRIFCIIQIHLDSHSYAK